MQATGSTSPAVRVSSPRTLNAAIKKEHTAKERVEFLERALYASENKPREKYFTSDDNADAEYYLYRERLNAARAKLEACEDSLRLALDRKEAGGRTSSKVAKLELRYLQ